MPLGAGRQVSVGIPMASITVPKQSYCSGVVPEAPDRVYFPVVNARVVETCEAMLMVRDKTGGGVLKANTVT